MIDRHGKPVQIGWAAHELLWLEVAVKTDRIRGLRDVAAMTGRSQEACKLMAYRCGFVTLRGRPAEALPPVVNAMLASPPPAPSVPVPSGFIRELTAQEKMTGRPARRTS